MLGPRGCCAPRGVRTGSRWLKMPSRGSRWHFETSALRAPRMWHWHRLTSVRLVRDTSVDHSGRLAGRVGCLCTAQGIQARLSHRSFSFSSSSSSSSCAQRRFHPEERLPSVIYLIVNKLLSPPPLLSSSSFFSSSSCAPFCVNTSRVRRRAIQNYRARRRVIQD